MPIKLSLICPVYKVAEFIPDLMQSLLQGVNSDQVEIIFVDDCCPENSISLCESFILEHKSEIKFNSTIIKQPNNKGQAAARNAALLIAKGEYIGFIDSDDAIASNYWDVLSSYVKAATNDIIEFSFEEFTSVLPARSTLVLTELESSNLNPFYSGFFVWTRLYRKSMLNGLIFPEGMIYEDVFYNVQAFSKASTTVKISSVLVYYRKRAGSTTSLRTSTYSQLLLNLVNSVKDTIERYEHKNIVISEVARFSLLTVLKGSKIKNRKDRHLFYRQCVQINDSFKPLFVKYNGSTVERLKFNFTYFCCFIGRVL